MNTKSFCWRTSRTAASVVLLRLVNTLAIAVAGCCLNPMHVRAGGVAPLGELAGGLMVPTNATIHEAPGPVPYPVTPAQSVSPSPTNSFQALADDNTSIPPDTHGAIGPNHVMTMLNTQVRIQSRAGTTNYSTVALSSWWTGVGTFTSIFDPRILYDPYENRWIAISAVDANLSTSGILLGASTSSDPTGTWTRQRVKADAAGTAWADFPSVGFNKNWIVVQVNLFSNANNAFLRSQILAFNKTNVFAGGTNRTVINDSTIGGTQMPAVTYDSAVGLLARQCRFCAPVEHDGQNKERRLTHPERRLSERFSVVRANSLLALHERDSERGAVVGNRDERRRSPGRAN